MYIMDKQTLIHIKKDNNMEEKSMAIVKVIRPELTPEERSRRMAAIKKAATDLVISAEVAKKRKESPK